MIECERCGRYVQEPPQHRCIPKTDVKVVVAEHGYYGCDTGCCGMNISFQNTAGEEWDSEFTFSHPDDAEDAMAEIVDEARRRGFADGSYEVRVGNLAVGCFG